MNNNSIIVFTDGSSRGNPGPGGWAASISYNNNVIELGGHEQHTTNNRMELTAVIQALNYLKNKKLNRSSVTIHTDSSYVVKGITQWVHGWQVRGWQTASKQPVLNKDLWQELARVVEEIHHIHTVSWNLVKGHAGNVGNERVDTIATRFADNKEVMLFVGTQDRYSAYSEARSEHTQKKIKKELTPEQKRRSKAKAYSYVSLVDGVFLTHATWRECEARVKGIRGARFKKALSIKDEQDIKHQWLG